MVTKVGKMQSKAYATDHLGYHSWRKLGDITSSHFALSYHEDFGNRADVPGFLRTLRSEAFNRAFSADKNVLTSVH